MHCDKELWIKFSFFKKNNQWERAAKGKGLVTPFDLKAYDTQITNGQIYIF